MSQTIRAVPDRRNKMQSVNGRRHRLTRNDELVLDCLRDLGQPAKAYDLLEHLRAQGINAPMTVYRALSRLCEAGLVKKIESLNAFCALPEDACEAFGAFLICKFCGAAQFRALGRPEVQALFGDMPISEVSIEVRSACFDGPFPRSCERRAPAA